MKTTKLFVAALAAVTMFSCAKKQDDTTTQETKSVMIKVVTPPLSKVEKDPVTDGYKTKLNDITVFFLNSIDQVVAGGGTLPLADADAGHKFMDVNSSATQAYVLANVDPNVAITSIGVGSTLDDIEALEGLISSQMDGTAMGVDDAVLSGLASTFAVVTPGVEYSAAVTIKPAVCRLEIQSISGATPITKFDLTNIYINNYYKGFTVGGGIVSGTQVGLSLTAADLLAVDTYMKDAFSTLIGANSYNTPASGKVMAYMLPVSVGELANPRIVFQLANVHTNTQLLPDPKYVTVTKLIDVATSLPVVLERGKVYRVNNVEFSDVDDTPNANKISVIVSVEVSGWEVAPVNPVI